MIVKEEFPQQASDKKDLVRIALGEARLDVFKSLEEKGVRVHGAPEGLMRPNVEVSGLRGFSRRSARLPGYKSRLAVAKMTRSAINRTIGIYRTTMSSVSDNGRKQSSRAYLSLE